MESTRSPSTAMTVSPVRSPASAAGVPGETSRTVAPARVALPSDALPSWDVTPRYACWAVPLSMSCVAIDFASLTGMAKPMPMLPPCVPPEEPRVAIELMPTSGHWR